MARLAEDPEGRGVREPDLRLDQADQTASSLPANVSCGIRKALLFASNDAKSRGLKGPDLTQAAPQRASGAVW